MAEPMYRTIAQELQEQIRSGAVRPGERLPTELELRDKYSASRNTVRDALKWLAARGLVDTKPGQGTFAAQRVEPFVTILSTDPRTGLSGVEGKELAEVAERRRIAVATVPRVEVRSAPRYIAERLHVPEGSQVITRRLERYIDRAPQSLETTAYPMELVERGATRLLMAEEIAEGAIAYLRERLGIKQTGHRDRLLVRPPSEDEVRFFKLSDDGRVFVVSIVRTGYRYGDGGPVPFRVTFTVFPADRNQLVIDSGEVPKDLPGPARGLASGDRQARPWPFRFPAHPVPLGEGPGALARTAGRVTGQRSRRVFPADGERDRQKGAEQDAEGGSRHDSEGDQSSDETGHGSLPALRPRSRSAGPRVS